MKQKKLIDLYKEWMVKHKLPSDGLCNSIPEKYKRYFWLMEEEYRSGTFWAYPITFAQQDHISYDKMAYPLTPLRETIILFICAMAGEI